MSKQKSIMSELPDRIVPSYPILEIIFKFIAG